jgi:hypothetical protein
LSRKRCSRHCQDAASGAGSRRTNATNAAATAMILDAALVTGDPEFRVVADLVEIRWIA